MAKKTLTFLFILALFTSGTTLAASFPDRPTDPTTLTFDYANILDNATKEEIHRLQESAYSQYKVPIVVVTINRMSDYGMQGRSIERFARKWFNHWQIGSKEENRGILFLISLGDRRARIELGADWGRGWDRFCQSIMDNQIVPNFKKGNYSRGILDGVKSLEAMSTRPPASGPPKLVKPSIGTKKWFISNLPIIAIVLGVLLIIAGIFLPEQRKALIITGIVLIVGAFAFYFLFLAAFVFLKSKGFLGKDSGGGSSSGGFGGSFGGGFSGGGGASGSW